MARTLFPLSALLLEDFNIIYIDLDALVYFHTCCNFVVETAHCNGECSSRRCSQRGGEHFFFFFCQEERIMFLQSDVCLVAAYQLSV